MKPTCFICKRDCEYMFTVGFGHVYRCSDCGIGVIVPLVNGHAVLHST